MKVLRYIVLVSYLVAVNIHCAKAISLIRDAEIEGILTEIVKPIFIVAGLRPESAKVYIINDDNVNAFTIGNGYIFIHSGMILQFNNPIHLIAVLCHETAHMAAGHVSRMINRISSASNNMTLAMFAAIIGAAVAKTEEAIGALIGYAMLEERFVLKFSRNQELEADSLAASYLEKLNYDASALMEVFDIFDRIEMFAGIKRIPIYIRSHPSSRSRISFISKFSKQKKYIISNNLQRKYDKIHLKLKSYLKTNSWPPKIPQDKYMKAIYFNKNGKAASAIEIMKELIKENPSDIYYKDTLAQMLYESGQIKKAIKIYKEIYSNDLPILIQIEYAMALIESNLELDLAIKILEKAKYVESFNDEIFRLLAKAYGKLSKNGISFLMLAKEQILLGNYKLAHNLLKKSIEILKNENEKTYLKKAKYLNELIERDYKRFL